MKTSGFTLIELLVVIAIIAILAAILFPVFAQAKLAAKKTKALAQMKQLSLSAFMYAADNEDYMVPASNRTDQTQDPTVWPPLLIPYVNSEEIFVAPESGGKFAMNWANRSNQSIGYSDATGVDPVSTAVEGSAPVGTEGFTSAVNFSRAEEAARIGIFASTPNSVSGKERGYVFNPYNGPNDPGGDYSKGLPLIADWNICPTSPLDAKKLKPIFARYGGTGKGEGMSPVVFADGHAKMFSANAMNAFGKIIWRFR